MSRAASGPGILCTRGDAGTSSPTPVRTRSATPTSNGRCPALRHSTYTPRPTTARPVAGSASASFSAATSRPARIVHPCPPGAAGQGILARGIRVVTASQGQQEGARQGSPQRSPQARSLRFCKGSTHRARYVIAPAAAVESSKSAEARALSTVLHVALGRTTRRPINLHSDEGDGRSFVAAWEAWIYGKLTHEDLHPNGG